MSQDDKNPYIKRIEDLEKQLSDLKTSSNDQTQRLISLAEELRKVGKRKTERKPDVQAGTSEDGSAANESVDFGHMLGCKDCYDKHLGALSKELPELVICNEKEGGCGRVVRKSDPKCPFCGNTHARER